MILKTLSVFFIAMLLLLACNQKQNPGKVGLVEKNVEYSTDSTTMKGFLVYDGDLQGKRPGVLVVHEWWGNNEYSHNRARMLAKLGYIALALDMYGNGNQADNPNDAGKYAAEVFSNISNAEARFMAAYNLLKSQEQTDPENIGAIGYCFGGSVVLHMARAGMDLKAIVSFHGGLQPVTPANPNTVKAHLLICAGDADQFVPKEQRDTFEKEMNDAGVKYEMVVYPDAKHAFSNPDADKYAKEFNLPIGYNEKADKDSWEKMKEFFKMYL
jgi:dienelactone hydrolase